MQALFQKHKKEYDTERLEMWKACEKYISKHTIPCKNEDIKLNKGTYKIPRTPKITQYTFYNYTEKNIIGKDDQKLRYIPYIKDVKDLTGIDHYIELSFKEPVICEESTIKRNVLLEVLFTYNDKDMYKLKKCIKSKEFSIDILDKFPLIRDFLVYTNTSVHEIIFEINEWSDNKFNRLFANKNALYNHFCGVCNLFDCGIHEMIRYEDAIN